jgi:hypothetical protein
MEASPKYKRILQELVEKGLIEKKGIARAMRYFFKKPGGPATSETRA